MDAQDGLPRLIQLFPTDGCKGNTTIDIIAVHGIETHSPKTWIAHEQDEEPKGRATNWLCDGDMLPKVIPQARIWAYNYNSNCYSDDAQRVDILGLGDTFLRILWGAKDKDVGRRLLIFIGSCFGGVVVAQALERASRDQMRYGYLLSSTAGIVFLGTPLRGTATASIAGWVACIRELMGKETSTSLLKSLEQEASSLDTLIHDFSKMAIANKFHIRCFYETRKTQIMNAFSRPVAKWISYPKAELVSRESACLDGHMRIPLDVRHVMMNKFRGPDDGNFVLVSRILREIVDNARISQGLTAYEVECLRCLTSNYREDKDRNEKQVPGTCKWVLEHQMFLSWRQKDTASLLWISADPGCGKSVLSRALVDEGLLSHDIRRSSVCYFFFKDDDASRQSGANALCAILHQLFVQKPALLRHAKTSWERHGTALRIMFRELWDILNICASDPEGGEIVCVLDALDECEQRAREDLIKQLSWFYSTQNQTNTRLKFVATSRPYYDIDRFFNSSIRDISTIQLNGEEESENISNEIDLVISYQVPRISESRKFPLKPEVQNALMDSLKKIPHRTYLWLHLILDVIRESLDSTSSRLTRLITQLPRTVKDAYEHILLKIKDSKQARRLLHIVVEAARPLTLQEMNVALAIDEKLDRGESCQSYDELDLEYEASFPEKVRNLCGLFVRIIDSKIYLIHQTAKEFLISNNAGCISTDSVSSNSNVWRHSLNPKESNLILAKICLSYLLFHELNREFTWSKRYSDNALLFTFFNYAAENWITHYRQARIDGDNSVLQSVRKVCDRQSYIFQRWFRECHDGDSSSFKNEKSTNLMIASYLGLEALVKLLLKQNRVELNLKDFWGLTELSLAASRGHTEVVRLLLKQDGIKPNLKDSGGHTALSWAAFWGHDEVVRLLLEQDDVELNFKDFQGQTALSRAAHKGHAEVVRLLLNEGGVTLNLQDFQSQTALSRAAHQCQAEEVRLLLNESGVELNFKDSQYQTAISLAKDEGHAEVVKLLLKQDGAKAINLKDINGQTALSRAAYRGDAEVVGLLLKQDGVELNFKDSQGRTELSGAAYWGHAKVVRLLLNQDGVEINLKDSQGQTALSHAAYRGHAEVVNLLLRRNKIELNPMNEYDPTPLIVAATHGRIMVVKLLLQHHSVELNLKNHLGQTALLLAACWGHAEVVRLLLGQNGVELNLKDFQGQTALSRAAYRGHAEVVRLLLNHNEINLNPTITRV